MQIRFAVSTWNYTHYASIAPLDAIINELRVHDYGIEMWPSWGWEAALKDHATRLRLRETLSGMAVSMHTGGVSSREEHAAQIDAAAELGATVLVLHPSDICIPEDEDRPDVPLARWVAAYAEDRGVKAALENGQFPFIEETLESVAGMNACLDVGHVYLTDQPMSRFLDVMAPRLVHLHLQDTRSALEMTLNDAPKDHCIPGTGGIPDADWQLFVARLRQIDFEGTAVLEIRPRSVLQSALLGRTFVSSLL